VPEVRLIGDDGKQIGVVKTPEALRYAQERDLDLVEVAPDSRPPVCRVLDYSKYKYEQAQKQKAARKHQQQITIREIKFRPKIAQNDYDTKKGHVRRFLSGKDKVKITIMFRGREVTHPDRGTALLDRLAEELSDVGVIEQSPLQDGRNMTMMLAPSKAVLAAGEAEHPEADAQRGGHRRKSDRRRDADGSDLEAANGSDVKGANGAEAADSASSEVDDSASTEAEVAISSEAEVAISSEAEVATSSEAEVATSSEVEDATSSAAEAANGAQGEETSSPTSDAAA
jgi:translation initiation factor IF-3